MGIVKDLTTASGRVHAILQKYEETRDNDKLLWLAYNSLYGELKTVIKSGDYGAFKAWLMKQDTPMFESLSRCRRKIQEEHPELEGNKSARMEIAEEVKEIFS